MAALCRGFFVSVRQIRKGGIPTEVRTLGEKLRALRREQHLTQEQAAGDYITRNMLSRIETDDVSPSLDTLRYLAGRLNVPIGYLLSEKDDLDVYLRPERMEELKALYRAGDFAGAEALCEKYGLYDDETDFLLCDCSVRRGKNAYAAGDFPEAARCFDAALRYAEGTVYPTEAQRAEVLLYRGFLAALAGEPTDTYLDEYRTLTDGAAGAERYLLERLFSHDPVPEDLPAEPLFSEEAYRTLIEARRAVFRGDHTGAGALLSRILDSPIIKNDPLLDARCTEMTELCAAETGDFRTAYLCSKKRSRIQKLTPNTDRNPTGDKEP